MVSAMGDEIILFKSCNFFGTKLDILCADGIIKEMGCGISGKGAFTINADGLFAAPGIVDMHVHFRDPGQTHKEDIISGCAAAAAGGITSVAAMPNTSPACDSAEIVKYELEKAKPTGVHLYPVAAVTKGISGRELCDFKTLKAAGAAAFSDDGHPVPSAGIMLSAMKSAYEAGAPIVSHCEDMSLACGIVNEGAVSEKLGVRGIPNAAETVMAAREAALALTSGLPVHIAHVSAAQTVGVIRDAKKRGAKITAETCPHYISLDQTKLMSRDADYRMNPPLRTQNDINAVVEGLKDGTIDAIVTDHAPHASWEKSDFEKAPNGVVGLETSLAACITFLVKTGHLTLAELFEKMSANPAKILGINAGKIIPGAPADIVLFDPDESFEVKPELFHSKSRNTPFKGMTLYGRVKYTVSGGKIIYKD